MRQRVQRVSSISLSAILWANRLSLRLQKANAQPAAGRSQKADLAYCRRRSGLCQTVSQKHIRLPCRLTRRCPANRQLVRRSSGLNTMASSGRVPSRLKEALAGDWRIILGSASKSRRGIMDSLCQEEGLSYEVVSADIDERAIGDRTSNPEKLVLELARAKAAAIKQKLGNASPRSLLITCDQVVVHAGKVLEKPTSAEEAWSFIRAYSTGPALTVGSVICTNLWSGKSAEALDTAEVHFYPIPDAVTESMIQEGFVFHCAGGLMVEHPKVVQYIQRIDGTVDGVMGIDKDVAVRVMCDALEYA